LTKAARPRAARCRIGIDVGGTFTDFILVRADGSLVLDKSPTTPADQSEGVMNGLAALALREERPLGTFLASVETIVHGTTAADNTMITQSGAVTGLLTTEGHRDEIELRRGFKEDIWDPAQEPPFAICPRRRRIGIRERLDFNGNVVVPLDESAVRSGIARLKKQGVESLAVVFLFAFVNSAHEKRVAEIVRQEWPEVVLSLSHEVMPSAPEFERTSTTLVNAYVAPKIRRYVDHLATRLEESGFRGRLLLMQSNGGIMTPDYVSRRAIAVLGSGPTGGVMGACHVASQVGVRSFVAGDMGGTSYDVCLVRNGAAEVRSGWNWQHRYLIGLPMVDVESIGAGGGSIASVEAGALKVGPQSAGSEPGPICYGRGGRAPTVTDANLVLGYLDPDTFCGGAFPLRRDGVDEAILEAVGRPLGLTLAEAAHGIFRVVNASMANAIRRVSAKRGVDPRELVLVAYGGNGPIHAPMQAEELGIHEILVPRAAPAFSALGLLLTDPLLDELRSYIVPSKQIDVARLNALLDDMEEKATAALAAKDSRKGSSKGSGKGSGKIRVNRFAQLCYPGQTFEMAVPLASRNGRVTTKDVAATIDRFHSLHEALHTYASRTEEPILRGLRLQAVGSAPKPVLPRAARAGRPSSIARKGERRAYFDGRFTVVPVYEGALLAAGHQIKGPAIIEETFTTVVVHPAHRVAIDALGNYRIRL
jgi:N-methylhydantoinase A